MVYELCVCIRLGQDRMGQDRVQVGTGQDEKGQGRVG